jgi:hypothetical protein
MPQLDRSRFQNDRCSIGSGSSAAVDRRSNITRESLPMLHRMVSVQQMLRVGPRADGHLLALQVCLLVTIAFSHESLHDRVCSKFKDLAHHSAVILYLHIIVII